MGQRLTRLTPYPLRCLTNYENYYFIVLSSSPCAAPNSCLIVLQLPRRITIFPGFYRRTQSVCKIQLPAARYHSEYRYILCLNYRAYIAAEDPVVFRCILPNAASHYASTTGGLHEFEQTFRFHMTESIHLLRSWVGDNHTCTPKLIRRCAMLATALCVIEVIS
jgi:hypothetical protein